MSKRSKKLLDYLWQLAEKNNDWIRINNNPSFMYLSVEILWNNQISLAHYGEMNGDLMADPEMSFLKTEFGEYLPIFYQNHWIGIYQEAMSFSDDTFEVVNKPLFNDLIDFFNSWSENIIFQQNLENEIK